MKLDLSNVKLSPQDKKRKITIPEKMTKKLAYDLGFMIGDGSINIYRTGTKTRYMVICSSNLEDEKTFCKNFIIPLKKDLFNIKSLTHESLLGNNFQIIIHSKGILSFYHTVFGFPLGSKENISVPEIILNSKISTISQFVRGLSDSDFCITFKKKHRDTHYYPVIKTGLSSKKLIEDLVRLLIRFNIKPYVQYDVNTFDKRTKKTYIRHEIYISGRKNLKLWIKKIGFNNPKHVTKFKIWKKYGFCPIRTNLRDRIDILNKNIPISRFIK